MRDQKINFIPLSLVVWLQDIRKTVEAYDEPPESDSNLGKSEEANSSNDSIYDNVNFTLEKPQIEEKNADESSKEILYQTWPFRKGCIAARRRPLTTILFDYEEDGLPPRTEKERMIYFDRANCKLSSTKCDSCLSDITIRRNLGESETQEGEEPNLCASMSNLLARHREKHTEKCAWTWLNAEEIVLDGYTGEDYIFSRAFLNINDEYKRVNKLFEYLKSYNARNYCSRALNVTTRSLNVNYIFDSELVTEKPPVPPKRHKRKMNQRRVQTSPNFRKLRKTHLVKVKPVAVRVEFPIKKLDEPNRNDEVVLDETTLYSQDESEDCIKKKPLPFPANDPKLEYEISELLMMQRVTESSKERRRISTESKTFPISEEFIDSFQGCIKNIPEAQLRRLGTESHNKSVASEDDMSEFFRNLPSDVDGESQKKVQQFLESRKRKLKYQTKPKPPIKLREDIIIDWENDYENLSEPIILEGKSVVLKRIPRIHLQSNLQRIAENDCRTTEDCFQGESYENAGQDDHCDALSSSSFYGSDSDASYSRYSPFAKRRTSPRGSRRLTKANARSKITDIVTRYDKILKESDPKCDTDLSDKISVSSLSEGLNSYSDFESDINETIAAAEIWFNEKSSDENVSVLSWDVSEDFSKSSYRPEGEESDETEIEPELSTFEATLFSSCSEERMDTIMEDEYTTSEKIDWSIKCLSETNLLKYSQTRTIVEQPLSKSLDFFRDSLTEGRLEKKVDFQKHNSITSDVCEWMAKIRGIAFAEDQLFSNDNEWILSFDSEERAYFFEETSKKSLWALPDYSRENLKPEYNFSIQKSATESAINNEASAKLRINKDGGQARISASTRSSKAQSMLIEQKLDLSPKDGSKTFSMPRDLSKFYGEIIRVGVLNKTKISENGKKLRKNWTPSFVVLTESYLFFFKDAKSFQNMKNVISSSANHICLSLQGAVIEKGDKISSRKNVYKISSLDNTDVLIQTDKTPEAEEWFKNISCVIQKLPQDLDTVKDSPVLDSKSPSKVGRTKSLKVRSKDTGSMEDLSSTAEERQNKIKARLKKFFIRRPTVDSLKKKGIWKDEPVFGCSLEQITKNRNPRVPMFVEKCVECIESKEENMKTDGLYRASGNLSQVQKIRLEVDQNNLNIMKEEEDVHVLTGSLKLFFRELKEPLIPSKQLEPALLATDKHTRKDRIKDFQKIVKSLPTPNYDTLKFLLQHLLRVKEYHKFNRMNINNLAIVFGPTLMWPEQESANMALELMQQNVVIECLLKDFQEIFT